MAPMLCNPTMLLAAATLANIDKKLDAIQETQQELIPLGEKCFKFAFEVLT